MESAVLATPTGLIAALTPTPVYWREMSERLENLDQMVEAIIMTPLFQHTYGTVHGMVMENMVDDVRSATGLLASNVFTVYELNVFVEMDFVAQLNHGLALAARHLRPRVSTIPVDCFVNTVRVTAFTFVLKLIGEDLKNPRPVLQAVVEKLEISTQQRMSLLQASIANVTHQSNQIVLH